MINRNNCADDYLGNSKIVRNFANTIKNKQSL